MVCKEEIFTLILMLGILYTLFELVLYCVLLAAFDYDNYKDFTVENIMKTKRYNFNAAALVRSLVIFVCPVIFFRQKFHNWATKPDTEKVAYKVKMIENGRDYIVFKDEEGKLYYANKSYKM